VRLRKLFLFCVAALLGVAIVVLPALAASEADPTVNAVAESGGYALPPHWSPKEVAVVPAGTVTFTNSSATVPHGIIWVGAAPTCAPSVPVGKENFKPNWSGSCTFAQSGEYKYYCSYHGPAMSGAVFVDASGTIPSPSSPGQATSPTVTTSPPGSTTPSPTTGQSLTVAPTAPNASGSPLADSAARALKLVAGQRGKSVRGSLELSQAAVGGRLEVRLLAKIASLAGAGHATQTTVGRLARSSLAAGSVAFAVPLNAKARRALSAHRRLALTVKLLLAPLNGPAVRITRGVVLRP
jgi:plastocyanin